MSDDSRFWDKVNKTPSCWVWTGATFGRPKWAHNNLIYGHLRRGSTDWSVHRYSWTLANGPIPSGMQVNHHCDTPLCVRPDHLYLGTQTDNMRDRKERGRRSHPKRDLVEMLTREWGIKPRSVYERLAKMGFGQGGESAL